MALIDSKNNDIDYNKFARLSRQLRPGMVWVSSGAVEIGRLDYIRRHGAELAGETDEEIKTDYSAQGQAILMQTYRQFINSDYSVRQVLVEHYHFNDPGKRNHIKNLLLRAPKQNAVPIINYNDAASSEENRKMEINRLREEKGKAVELVDNDETAAQIACLVEAKRLIILTGVSGIFRDLKDPASLIPEITGNTIEETLSAMDDAQRLCRGASRAGANGAGAKIEYVKPCIKKGIEVFIASADYDIADIISGSAPRTKIYTK